jgi:hypothetical protein
LVFCRGAIERLAFPTSLRHKQRKEALIFNPFRATRTCLKELLPVEPLGTAVRESIDRRDLQDVRRQVGPEEVPRACGVAGPNRYP